MAVFKAHQVSQAALRDGEWIAMGPAWGDGKAEMLVRGQNGAYNDYAQFLREEAAKANMVAVGKLPNDIAISVNARLCDERLLMDVRNLVDDNKNPVDIGEFRQMLYDPDMRDAVIVAVFTCSGQVGRHRNATGETARGN